jgi:hypothetical protein
MEMHVPEIMTVEGFCDIMAVDNLCEMGKLLECPWYTGELHPNTLEECLSAAWYYRQLQGWFGKQFTILVGETPTKRHQCSRGLWWSLCQWSRRRNIECMRAFHRWMGVQHLGCTRRYVTSYPLNMKSSWTV